MHNYRKCVGARSALTQMAQEFRKKLSQSLGAFGHFRKTCKEKLIPFEYYGCNFVHEVAFFSMNTRHDERLHPYPSPISTTVFNKSRLSPDAICCLLRVQSVSQSAQCAPLPCAACLPALLFLGSVLRPTVISFFSYNGISKTGERASDVSERLSAPPRTNLFCLTLLPPSPSSSLPQTSYFRRR